MRTVDTYVSLFTVEGAHSDEQNSHRSGSEDGSKGGSRTLPPLLGDFDVLRFKNRFLEVGMHYSSLRVTENYMLMQVVEEVRMRRVCTIVYGWVGDK